jgi:hypothetical protein
MDMREPWVGSSVDASGMAKRAKSHLPQPGKGQIVDRRIEAPSREEAGAFLCPSLGIARQGGEWQTAPAPMPVKRCGTTLSLSGCKAEPLPHRGFNLVHLRRGEYS